MQWNKIWMGTEGPAFLLEIAFRTLVMFLLIVMVIRLTGKRGVKQFSLFEIVMIVALGSAAGDPMIYKEVGIVYAIVSFAVVLLVYKAVIHLISKNGKVEQLLEGRPEYIIKDGKFLIQNKKVSDIGLDEFFSELRQQQVDHLGQIRSAVLEKNGAVSILFQEDKNVKPGLPIWPELYDKKNGAVEKPGDYACSLCGHAVHFDKPEKKKKCDNCKKDTEWVFSIDIIRVR